MGIVKKLGKPITGAGPTGSTRSIGHRSEGTLQGSGRGAEQQIKQRQAPFSNDGQLRFGAPPHARFAADQPQGSSAGGTRPRAATAAAPRSQVMSHEEVLRGAGYSKAPNLAGYKVHDVTTHRFDGNPAPRGRQAPEVTRGRNTVGRKRLVSPMSDSDFAEGAKLYRREHGGL
jgi:hypothetical protein